jgi:iron complex outermembrane receptor protein
MKPNTSRIILSLCLALFATAMSFAQTATIKGKISLPNNENADNVSVTLKGTKIGTLTDGQGQYEIKNLKAGSYILKVSLVGYAAKEKSIGLAAGDEIVENFDLTPSSELLKEITIETAKANPFARKESAVVSKMPLKDIENPQIYNTISSELLKEQVVTNFDDALKNAPGIDKLWESTGRGGDGAGYFSLRGFA